MEKQEDSQNLTLDDGAAQFISAVKAASSDTLELNRSQSTLVYLSSQQARQHRNREMNAPTREEFDAKLEAIEARMDGRVARIEGKIDSFLAQLQGNEKAMQLLAEKAAMAAQTAGDAANRAGGIKSTLWITSITTILSVLGIALAAYFGTQQSNIGIVQSTIAAFESGRNAAPATSAATSAQDSKKNQQNKQ